MSFTVGQVDTEFTQASPPFGRTYSRPRSGVAGSGTPEDLALHLHNHPLCERLPHSAAGSPAEHDLTISYS